MLGEYGTTLSWCAFMAVVQRALCILPNSQMCSYGESPS